MAVVVALLVALASAQPRRCVGDLVWNCARACRGRLLRCWPALWKELESGRFWAGLALPLSAEQRSGLY